MLTCPSCLYTELVPFYDYHLCPHCGWSTKSGDGKCDECGKGIGHFLTCSQHPDHASAEPPRVL